MHDISEHDSEEKWERNASEHRWVHFLVTGDTISINNLLEKRSEFIGLEKGWLHETWHLGRTFLDIQTLKALNVNNVSNDLAEIERFRAPDEPLEDSARLLHHVEVVVDCLLTHHK
jgi:hypothetical protein